MTQDEFTQTTNKLEQFYAKELNDIQRQQWYSELRKIPVERYRRVTREIMSTRKFMPNLAEVLEINRTIRSTSIQPDVTVPCKICGGLGLVRFYKKVDGYVNEIFAKCTCQNALNKWGHIENGATYEELGFSKEDFMPKRGNKGETIIPKAIMG